MTTAIDYQDIKTELAVFLRNSNIYTTTQRAVVTTSQTGTISGSTITISRSDVKNVRSLTVANVTKVFGTDYTTNYDDAGAATITFATTQSGTVLVSYDYGTDKIFADLPRNDLTLSNFPRIGIDIIGDNSEDIELGAGTKLTTLTFSIYVYDFKAEAIDDTLKLIRTAMMQNQKLFYYQKYVNRIRTGPLLIFQEYGKTKIMLKAVDYVSKYNLEYV